MARQILMPALSPTMAEGRLARWLVREGDTVAEGDVLAEIETDKATLDFESSSAGQITRLLVAEGTAHVAVDTPIAILAAEVETGAKPANSVVAPPLHALDPVKATVALPPAETPPSLQLNEWPEGTRLENRAVREALRDAMAEEMRRDDSVLLMGLEVAENQGAYNVSQGLWEEFGSRRVVDTPITEAGFAGLGIGAAFGGLRPIVEFMSFSFALQAMDQIVNSAAKSAYMSGGTMQCPIVFRGPNGAAARVAAQHSLDLSSWFAQIPGLKVLAPYCAADAKGLLKAAIRDPGPVIFLEHEALYGQSHPVPVEEDFVLPIGKARLWREGSDVTLVGYGRAMQKILEAASDLEEQGLSAEVIDLRALRPLDSASVVASLKRTHRCVIVEEALPMGSIGDHLARVLMQEAFDWLDAPVLTIAGADVPMPYAEGLESAALPTVGAIVQAARSVCYR